MYRRALLQTIRPDWLLPAALAITLAGVTGLCGCSSEKAPPSGPPNILWIVWDTVRADHLSLYGHERQTTPRLSQRARSARVYEDCLAAANYTVASHASMFTGLLPSRHGAINGRSHLADEHETIAELLARAGYRTFLFSANPHISADENFAQGFETAEHPWSEKHRARARELVLAKADARDPSHDLDEEFAHGRPRNWDFKESGPLAEEALLAWLADEPAETDAERPFFAFLNYMEAHRPYLPRSRSRAQFMSPEEVERSYGVDQSWTAVWSYTFGLHEFSAAELDLMRATYDATLFELDELLDRLLARLEDRGALENTVVVLTADHGEHLGEHHMLDHQYSLYQPLIHVPLVVWAPGRLESGRDPHPVMNHDLFPTLLRWAGVSPPPGLVTDARDLERPDPHRRRVAESLGSFRDPFRAVWERYVAWDPSPWNRDLQACVTGGRKLILAPGSSSELYALASDPLERRDLAAQRPQVTEHLSAALQQHLDGLAATTSDSAPVPDSAAVISPEHRARLETLGYLHGGESSLPPIANEEAGRESVAERAREAQDTRREAPLALDAQARAEALPAGTPVILITVDRLRADQVTQYERKSPVLPGLRALAEESIEFSTCYAPATQGATAMAALMTSQFPPTLAAAGEATAAPLPTLAAVLVSAGYEALGVCAHSDVRAAPRVSRGFTRIHGEDCRGEPAACLIDLARRTMERAGDRTLLWLHLSDLSDLAHPRAQASYDSRARALDGELAELLEAWRRNGLLDRALLVLTAPRATAFRASDERSPEPAIPSAALHVPLLIRLPGGVQGGIVVPELVRTIDVVPTVLYLLGQDVPQAMIGASLRGSWQGNGTLGLIAYARDQHGGQTVSGLIHPQYDVHFALDRESGAMGLYSLSASDGQGHNLVGDDRWRTRTLRRIHDALVERARERILDR